MEASASDGFPTILQASLNLKNAHNELKIGNGSECTSKLLTQMHPVFPLSSLREEYALGPKVISSSLNKVLMN